jgi:tetratricopeptide (TPR) repeat protein
MTPLSRHLFFPALYLSLGLALLWAASSSEFVREDALTLNQYSGRLQNASFKSLWFSREVGEDSAYYRPIQNVFLAGLSRGVGSTNARPFRLASGLLWLACAASLVPLLMSAGVSPPGAWAGAGLLMIHPYNSWYFCSAEIVTNALVLPLAVLVWFSFLRMENNPKRWLFAVFAATFAACLSRESAVVTIGAVVASALLFAGSLTKRRALGIAVAILAVAIYAVQRQWVLWRDPPAFDWTVSASGLTRAPEAVLQYARALAGSFRMVGRPLEPSGPWPWFLLAAAGGTLLFALRNRPRPLVAALLFFLAFSETALAAAVTGEAMPARGTVLVALGTGLFAWWGFNPPVRLRRVGLIILAGGAWFVGSARHLYASRTDAGLLEIHSRPPYSWKIESERAVMFLKRREPFNALEAARAAERLRPSWLTRVLRASVESVVSPSSGTVAELEALARTGTREPGGHIGFVNLGVALARNERWEEARACFEKALAAAPGFSRALSEWAWLEVSRGEWRRGAELAEGAIRSNPSDANAWQNLAYARLRRHDWTGAAAAYERLSQLDPGRPGAAFHRALALERAGAADAAKAVLREQQDPQSAALLFLLTGGAETADSAVLSKVKKYIDAILRDAPSGAPL